MCDTGEIGGWFSGLPVLRPGTICVSAREPGSQSSLSISFVLYSFSRAKQGLTIISLDVEVEAGSDFGPLASAFCCAYATADVTAVHICRSEEKGRNEVCSRGTP